MVTTSALHRHRSSHSHTVTESHTHSHSLTHSHIHSHTHTHTLTHSLTHTLIHTHTHTLTHTHTHSFTHAHTHTHTLTLLSPSHTAAAGQDHMLGQRTNSYSMQRPSHVSRWAESGTSNRERSNGISTRIESHIRRTQRVSHD